MAHDLVIRNGTVVDGSGLGSYRADVGVDGDRITEIGRIVGRGRREIDADGHVVTPGSSTATPTWTPRSSGTPPARARAGTG